jgi:TonB family protein
MKKPSVLQISSTPTTSSQASTQKQIAATAAPQVVTNEWRPYLADLQRRIKRRWFLHKSKEARIVVVVFKVHGGGELSDLRIERSSGIAIEDQSALKSVENGAPFRPLQRASDVIEVRFTFDYNLAGGGQATLLK